jgi:hypothetical protein
MRVLSGLRKIGRVLRKAPADDPRGQLRTNAPQGPFSSWFRGYIPRQVSPEFYEVIRKAVPIIDAAIRRLSSLTGTLQVEGDNGKLVDELKDFFTYVPVNDFQTGIQAFLDGIQNETFEQGFGVGEYIFNKDRNDIERLRVGDSKLIFFVTDPDTGETQMVFRPRTPLRNYYYDATTRMQQILAGTWNMQGWFPWYGIPMQDITIDLANKIYLCFHVNNQDPYGESIISSLEFVAQLLLTIQNSQMSVWERFGDPSYQVLYKSGKLPAGTDMLKRRKEIAKEFSDVMAAKKTGKSGDFVEALDKDSSLEIKVIGADGKVIAMEIPVQHCLDMVCSKTGLTPWMLGIPKNVSAGLSEKEVELVLADAEVRKAALLPSLNVMVKSLLRARGRTWKPGDWTLSLQSPNLHDLVATAQAGFLNAQQHLMESNTQQGATTMVETAPDESGKMTTKVITTYRKRGNEKALPLRSKLALYRSKVLKGGESHCHETKDHSPQADAIVRAYYDETAALWDKTKNKVLKLLSLPQDKAFSFTPDQLAQVRKAVMAFADAMAENSSHLKGPVATFTGRAHALGILQAAEALGGDTPELDLMKNRAAFQELLDSGFQLVRDNATKFYQDEIKPAMQAGMERGSNLIDMAREMEAQFGDWNSNWERLVRSEVALAQETGKLNEWEEQGVETVHFSPAPGACEICMSLEGDYKISECPVPMADTHPNCACAVTLA